MMIDVWLYGEIASYSGNTDAGAYAHLEMEMTPGSTMRDVLSRLCIPAAERGPTFINSALSAMSGLQPDLGHVLADNDRIGIFSAVSMWPYQYRFGAKMTPELAAALKKLPGGGLHHAYDAEG